MKQLKSDLPTLRRMRRPSRTRVQSRQQKPELWKRFSALKFAELVEIEVRLLLPRRQVAAEWRASRLRVRVAPNEDHILFIN